MCEWWRCLKFIVMIIAQLYACNKYHWMVHFKYAYYMVCKLQLNNSYKMSLDFVLAHCSLSGVDSGICSAYLIPVFLLHSSSSFLSHIHQLTTSQRPEGTRLRTSEFFLHSSLLPFLATLTSVLCSLHSWDHWLSLGSLFYSAVWKLPASRKLGPFQESLFIPNLSGFC